MNFNDRNLNEFNAVLAILSLSVALNIPSWILAIALWTYILATEK